MNIEISQVVNVILYSFIIWGGISFNMYTGLNSTRDVADSIGCMVVCATGTSVIFLLLTFALNMFCAGNI
jgi:hypothetical protein